MSVFYDVYQMYLTVLYYTFYFHYKHYFFMFILNTNEFEIFVKYFKIEMLRCMPLVLMLLYNETIY